MVQSPAEALQAKPASKNTPPNQVQAELEAEGRRDEAREVVNELYMFDTESEDEEDGDEAMDVSQVKQGESSRQRRTATVKDPDVDEIEMSMRNMGKL